MIDKFAGYGFNKSHAAAYALVAYHTGWLKAHHRPEFYAASMSFDIALTDKLSLFVEDMRRGEVECLPPCINASQAAFLGRGRQGPLRFGSAQGRRREGDGSTGRGAGGEGAVQVAGRFRRPHRSRGSSTAARSKALPRQAHSTPLRRIAQQFSPRPRPFLPTPPARPSSGQAASTACSAVQARLRRSDPSRQGRAMVAGSAHGRRARLVRLLLLGASGRLAPPPARGEQGQDLRAACGHADAGGGPRRGNHGRSWSRRRAGGRRRRAGAT